MNKEIEILIDGKPTKMKLPPDMQDSKIVVENGKVFVETGVVDYINNLKFENQRLNNDIKILLKENEAKEKVIIKQDNVLNELEKDIKNLYTYGIKNNREQKDYLLNRLEGFKEFYELKESDK